MEAADDTQRTTVYASNLNDRASVNSLKRQIYFTFAPFGPILDIVAYKTMKKRGQAFIVFQDNRAATRAIDELQGELLLDKPMRLALAKTTSNSFIRFHTSMQMQS
ncbi:U1 small nuclear ribonucleoprotein [Carpediemonas membranifera]|uniref:U1 small nuclear ribonucleoprotein n=1 Tax=Carpediemonas membranifera TaxID=201153 RepID=A0A8J6AVV5_9EUKA|nr:U1 small nuclear ribonucleoprotein [Carpediemonas membranifera]|eukprot:KAG9395488.1 U1 small nuclear ribonucleoprotein [Carpediemonas membranifera]